MKNDIPIVKKFNDTLVIQTHTLIFCGGCLDLALQTNPIEPI